MSGPIDISVRIQDGMACWPGSPGVRLHRMKSIGEGDETNDTRLDMDVHCGTHVEGPLHFIDGGAALGTIPLDALVGPAHLLHLPDVDRIGPNDLAAVPEGIERLLIRTRNSDLWDSGGSFRKDYVALTVEAAAWIAERGMRLIGVDYLSIQAWGGDPETHRVLMRAGVAIVEGLNLADAPAGDYRLTCLPLRIESAEAAPARAILEPMA